MYIKSVQFKDDYRCFSKGDSFNFENITILVGDQGCGKSSLLDLLSKNDKILNVTLTDLGKRGVETFYFDAEKMNPRVRNPELYTTPMGIDKGIGYGAAIASRFTSHGETLKIFTIDALKKAKNCVIFLDEPESGLSLRNQFVLADSFKEVSERSCQLVVATHSLVLINSVVDVLSLEHGNWMSSKEFVEVKNEI